MSAATSSRRASDAELADIILSGATALAVPLSGSQVDRFVAYVRLIERWNATYNLTAIRDPEDMATHHVLDSLAAAAALGRRRGVGGGERVVDVGSGAGLPGVVIAMTFPDRQVTCVDSVGKKAAFISQAAGSLGLSNVEAVHARIESVSGHFDVVASRAFSSVPVFVAATEHLVDESGTWMAMKGKTPVEELAKVAAGLTFHVERLVVPHLAAERCVIWIEMPKASARLC